MTGACCRVRFVREEDDDEADEDDGDDADAEASHPAEAAEKAKDAKARAKRRPKRRRETNQDPDERQHRRWLLRWDKVWVPLIIGFIGGVATCVAPYIGRDIRNQVYEATYEAKQRALENQSELLKLQEEYLGKLKSLREAQEALDKANDEVKAREAETEQIRAESERAIAALKKQYHRLAADEARRVKAQKESQETAARRAPWKAYGCRLDWITTDGYRCNKGTRATFAPDTPAEKVVVAESSTCLKTPGPADDDEVEARCRTYGLEYLRSKNVREDDATAILEHYSMEDVIRRLNDVSDAASGLTKSTTDNDRNADAALRAKSASKP